MGFFSGKKSSPPSAESYDAETLEILQGAAKLRRSHAKAARESGDAALADVHDRSAADIEQAEIDVRVEQMHRKLFPW
jgi:hypothetical protein